MMSGDGSRRVLVVIVNYRSASLAIDCLRSLEPEVVARGSTNVVVVENASGDDSAEQLGRAIASEGWGGWASLVVAPKNGGFAAGNNVALAPALASATPPALIWLLNPDTIVRPGALGELIAYLDRNPEVGLVGSRLEFPDGQPQRSAFNFPTVLGELEGAIRLGVVTRALPRHVAAPPPPEADCRVDWVAGASLMVRREVFEAVGLLDEGYFMYYEEVDLCLKASRAGWPCGYAPASRVVHLVGQSSGVTDALAQPKRRPKYWFEARSRYFAGNHGRLSLLAANVTFVCAFATFRVRRLIQRKPDFDSPWMLWDFLRYNFLPRKSWR